MLAYQSIIDGKVTEVNWQKLKADATYTAYAADATRQNARLAQADKLLELLRSAPVRKAA